MRTIWWIGCLSVLLGCSNVIAGNPELNRPEHGPTDPGEIPEDEVVWRVTTFSPWQAPVGYVDVPELTITGDGTAYLTTPDEDDLSFRTGAVSAPGLYDLLAQTAGSGTFDADLGHPNIEDASLTRVQAYFDGQLSEISVSALLNDDVGLSSQQELARERLVDLLELAEDIVTDVSDAIPEHVEIVAEVDESTPSGEPTWPGPALEPVLGQPAEGCGALTGPDAAQAYAATGGSREFTAFDIAGIVTDIAVTPVLPGLEACMHE